MTEGEQGEHGSRGEFYLRGGDEQAAVLLVGGMERWSPESQKECAGVPKVAWGGGWWTGCTCTSAPMLPGGWGWSLGWGYKMQEVLGSGSVRGKEGELLPGHGLWGLSGLLTQSVFCLSGAQCYHEFVVSEGNFLGILCRRSRPRVYSALYL